MTPNKDFLTKGEKLEHSASQETRTYVGFGFGPIQAGLFLYEAFRSGAFKRLVVAEILPAVVNTVRGAAGRYHLNIAHDDRIEHAELGPIVIENPTVPEDRERLIEAIAKAQEISTAIPSVTYYDTGDDASSLHHVLAEGLRRKARRGGPHAVVYTAENHNRAAEILTFKVMSQIPEAEQEAVRNHVQFLNTVIGKMSGVVTDTDLIQARDLAPITPQAPRAFLVEAFNRILISKIRFQSSVFQRGIRVFEEKETLLPFEEAKLYGHNATHALGAYLGTVRGIKYMAALREIPGAIPFLRAAFIEESGAALIHKYAGLDPLFTEQGYRHYAEDLITRMITPHLLDTVKRVGRDPKRKLGWNDRLIGTMRLSLAAGVTPHHYAIGAAAALIQLNPTLLTQSAPIAPLLLPIWEDAPDQRESTTVLKLIENALHQLRHWYANDFTDSLTSLSP
jgi:mannitol-1-phosphate 5-dehydrogenase